MPEVEFKENDQIIVDNFLEQDYSSFKLLKSNVCIVLVVGKYDLIVKSHDSSYYPKVFPVSKSVGILEEIRHNNTSSKTAVVREGNKRTSISLSNLVVLEQKNEK